MENTERLKTVNIKGKDYTPVGERIKYFRQSFPGYRLITRILSCENGVVLMEAQVDDPEGNTVATGHAFEEKQSSFINKTSYIENCETSAIGRALGNFGIGIDASVCSADEIANAVLNQDKKGETPARESKKTDISKEMAGEIQRLSDKTGKTIPDILRAYKVKDVYDLTKAQYENAIKTLKHYEEKMELENPAAVLDAMLDEEAEP